ncbi:TraR/DksA family transcriptional regulator [Desulfohalovibrio reitneri]|uniref:TraR/DksA family transcriptional regulator n=1 Tax=Desulfohalovibrio reitneri TaxID=1307759 RepID=UPI0004A739EB|nr:TraR/DksA C4-type zinc finger protein [Desulfohalovibrio reitneri]
MTDQEKLAIRRHLEERLEHLLEGEQAGAKAEACADENEYASRVSEQNLNVALRERTAREINEIREAVRRMDMLGYGLCDECGEDISARRLKARPTATLCIRCQSGMEEGGAMARAM